MKKTLDKIFAMPLMVLFLLFFFLAIGIATFVENDFGTPIAQKWIYKATWFSVIIIYLSISLIYNMMKFKLFKLKKLSSLLFHLSFLVIVLGAGVTRYFGFEGVMLIREGDSSNVIISADTYMQIKAHDNVDQYRYDMAVTMDTNSIAYTSENLKWKNPFSFLFNHNNYFEHEFDFKESHVKISCVDVFKNPKDTLIPTAGGDPYLELVMGGMDYNYLKSGEVKLFESGLKVSLDNDQFTDAINITRTDSGLFIQSPYDLGYFQMSDQSQGIIVRDSLQEFIPKRLYTVGSDQFVFNQYYIGAELQTIQSPEYMNGLLGITLKIEEERNGNKYEKEVLIKGGKGLLPNLSVFNLESGLNFELGFGSKKIEVPFFIHLRDFELERYPGTMNPSSFLSEVTLIDLENGVEDEHTIFMNNVLDYGGYRFFQSSYDQDEKGTILSVNHDAPGTLLTYLGYLFLALGFVINLISPNSRFRMLIKKSKEIRLKRESLGVFLLLVGLNAFSGFGQEVLPVVDEGHAEKFGKMIVQDQGGRFKPVHTLAFEMLRKVSRESEWKNQNPVQVFIGLHTHPGWYQEPMIYVSGQPLRDEFHIEGKYAALADFLFIDQTQIIYLLQDATDEARRKKPSERNEYDKDVLKTDERINVMFGVFNMSYLRIFPKPNDSTNTWYAPFELNGQFEAEDSTFVSGAMKLYFGGVEKGYQSGDWSDANSALSLIQIYQQKTSPEELLPAQSTIEWEIWYNEADIFKKLMTIYFSLGFLILYIQFYLIIKDNMIQRFFDYLLRKLISEKFLILYKKITEFMLKWIQNIAVGILIVCVAFHGFGLGLRWYLSGHAPWSNGYEAVVFIAFITMIAGISFIRQSKLIIAATALLAGLMLFVAHMNQMDPEMTNLVPVLKSYWLMIHVAIITGSYGFLGLGAILGILILFLNLFLTRSNYKRVLMNTKELTHVSEMAITIGLFMLTIGTFLGGIWANESWGRYWGWDAKETWALASVLIYAVVIHMRFIPKLKSQFAFNAATLWAYGSIIMTFFGVNYYLSGLHSYAQGDPLPIPAWVPITVMLLGLLTVISYFRWKAAKKWATTPKEKPTEEIV